MSYDIFENLLSMHRTTVYRVSKETGISATTFTDWKNGRSTPKIDKLKRIADYFGVSLEYMMGAKEAPSQAGGTRVAIIGEIRAGSPIITDKTLLGYETADVSDTEEYFYLKVCGDSMKNCGIVEGSYVLFHKQQYAENGDVVACLVDGESATVKRFFKQNHRIVLAPENENYKPIVLLPDDFEMGRARILGVAIEVKTKL